MPEINVDPDNIENEINNDKVCDPCWEDRETNMNALTINKNRQEQMQIYNLGKCFLQWRKK